MSSLNSDSQRQAKAALRGYIYQIVRSIDIWLDLEDREELVLEGAEDFDRISDEQAVVGQVRETRGSGNITLRTAGVIDAINDFWTHRSRNPGFNIRYRYLTTSGIGMERGRPFGPARGGLHIWSRIRAAPLTERSVADAEIVAGFLRDQAAIRDELKDYLETAAPSEIIEGLIEPIEWSVGQGDADALIRKIKDKLVLHGERNNVASANAEKVFDALQTAAFEAASTRDAPPLTRAAFLRIFDNRILVQVPPTPSGTAARHVPDENASGEAKEQLQRHVIASNQHFSIFGVAEPLSMDRGWVELPIFVPLADESADPATVDEILERYRNGRNSTSHPGISGIANISIGRFYRHCVVIGGPGLGKSMLTRKLALTYARDGFPVIQVDLKALALAMRQGGTFLGNILTLGLGDASVSPDMIAPAFLASGVLLCDGLDEAGDAQDLIARHLAAFAETHPDCRVIVTIRPIGYETPHLAGWRHYEILGLDSDSAGDRVETLLTAIHPEAPAERLAIRRFVEGQLERNRDSGPMTHSPLLLGLCVLLGIHEEEFGSSRNELYERVFDRIEQPPNVRIDARPSGSLATRCVDVLGWVLTENPNAKLKQIRARCADILAGELGKSRLAAEMDFEQCIAFWQQTGMVERVRHAGNDMLLFVHKTFGEFAGARYMAGLPDDAARDALILAQSQRASSMELLRFAGGLGLAESVVGALLTPTDRGASHAMKILYCMEILADGDGALSAGLVDEILDAAFALARSSPVAAGSICPAMLHAVKYYPGEIAARARPLRDDPSNWLRLVAWACLATAGARHYDLDVLVSAFLELPDLGMHPEDFGPSPGSADRDEIQDLAVAFASAALGEILKQLPTDKSDALLATLLPRISAGDTPPSVEFMRRAMASLRSAGRGDDAERLFARWHVSSLEQQEEYASDFERVLKIVMDLLVDGAEEDSVEGKEDGVHDLYLHLGAYLEATRFVVTSNNGWEQWQQCHDREAASAVVRALLSLCVVDPAALRTDIRTLRAEVEARPKDALSRQWRLWERIDIPEPDYSGARMLDLSPALIEKAKQHPSTWISEAAARLYDGRKP